MPRLLALVLLASPALVHAQEPIVIDLWPGKAPGEAKELTQAQRNEIATFGRISTHADTEYAKQNRLTLETWHIRDESLAGMRLERNTGTGRFVHNQLVAVRPTDARSFVLATIRWLSVDENYVPRTGVRALPGVQEVVRISTPFKLVSRQHEPDRRFEQVHPRRFVELHGGTIDLVSQVGQGTTATLVLPLSRIHRSDAA